MLNERIESSGHCPIHLTITETWEERPDLIAVLHKKTPVMLIIKLIVLEKNIE